MLDLSKPMSIRARMARSGLAPNQLVPWWSPDTERMKDPLDSDETQADVRHFMHDLWTACLEAEGAVRNQASGFSVEETDPGLLDKFKQVSDRET